MGIPVHPMEHESRGATDTVNQSKSLCMIPWLHRFTNEQGRHQLCCSGTGPANDIHDSRGNLLHVSQGLTDAEVLNSPDLKAIRLAMLRGEWSAACERCRRSDEAGAVSVRQHVNSRFEYFIEDALRQTGEDGTLDRPQVRYADIRLGNVCNLTCRMCGPQSSRPWADHYNEVQPRGYLMPASQLANLRDSNWVKSQPVARLMEQCLPSLEKLHFAGGEPLLIPEMLESLDLCVRSGRADRIDLSYNTNITVLPEQVARFWPHFRSVSLLCSVDGFGPLNDYIRRPSKWQDIDRNLHLLDRHFDEWRIRKFMLSATVQLYNILQLGEIFDYVAAEFQHVTPVPQLVPLYYPSYLSIQNLPARVKDSVRERLLAARARVEARLDKKWHYILDSIDVTIAYMDEACSPRLLMDFLYFSEKSDREFGDSWRRACPELAQLLFPGYTAPREPRTVGL
jgi:MoaA/NifB/PqqE/SkfB family radical SAM enzyme